MKFKRCHGNPIRLDEQSTINATEIGLAHQQSQARERQRQAQQGMGKNIISAEVGDHRLVAVGNRVHYSKGWKTFTDFLMDYIRNVLGREWGNVELAKPNESDMHPVVQWYRHVCRLQKEHAGKPGEVYGAPETGAARAYNELAYNLYLLEHNVELRARLVDRLKHPDQFAGALTEIRVAGMLVRAGFEISFEDEDDEQRTHCEYTATHRETGKSFSVEVKTRKWASFPTDDVRGRRAVTIATRRLLRAALEKTADHERVVFIELDLPDPAAKQVEPWYLQQAFDGLRAEEADAANRGQQLPPAYVIVANHPYRHHLDDQQFRVGLVAEGVGAIDFSGQWRGTVHEAVDKREKHKHFLALWQSVEKHRVIPTTFDGSNPRLAFSGEPNRFQIGGRYAVPDPAGGGSVEGRLTDAVVMSADRAVMAVLTLADGRQLISSVKMTDAEWQAYQEHPDTFFGVEKKVGSLRDPLDLFDFMFASYKNTPREKLLELLASAPDLEQLRALSQQELARVYSERMTEATIALTGVPGAGRSETKG